MASPAMVLRSCLLDKGIVIMPLEKNKTIAYSQVPGDPAILCYVSSMPDDEDQCICIYDQPAASFGRCMIDGKMLLHMGLRIILRHLDYPGGWDMSQRIANVIDEITKVITVLNEVAYSVDNVYRIGSIESLGEEVMMHRQLFSISSRIVFSESQTRIG